jgi:hypothetical protein
VQSSSVALGRVLPYCLVSVSRKKLLDVVDAFPTVYLYVKRDENKEKIFLSGAAYSRP